MLAWQTDVLPLLTVVYELMNESVDGSVDGEEIAARLGVGEDEEVRLRARLRQLADTDYIRVGAWPGGMELPVLISSTEKGLQTTFGWPGRGGDSVELLLKMLDDRIADPDLPEEERTALQRLRGAAGSVGQGLLQSVLSAWLTHVTGAAGT
jgi:hypothetical protein